MLLAYADQMSLVFSKSIGHLKEIPKNISEGKGTNHLTSNRGHRSSLTGVIPMWKFYFQYPWFFSLFQLEDCIWLIHTVTY